MLRSLLLTWRFIDLPFRDRGRFRTRVIGLRYQTPASLRQQLVLFDLGSKRERESNLDSTVAYTIHLVINNQLKWMKKERKGKREKGRRFKGKYSQTPREATPAELLADVAGGLLTSRAINIFIRRFLSAPPSRSPVLLHMCNHCQRLIDTSQQRGTASSVCEIDFRSLISVFKNREKERENKITFWSKVFSEMKYVFYMFFYM